MESCDLGAAGERLAVAGDAGAVRLDHDGIGEDYSERVFGLADGNELPVLVSPELREREPARYFHRVLSCTAIAMRTAMVSSGNEPEGGEVFVAALTHPHNAQHAWPQSDAKKRFLLGQPAPRWNTPPRGLPMPGWLVRDFTSLGLTCPDWTNA